MVISYNIGISGEVLPLCLGVFSHACPGQSTDKDSRPSDTLALRNFILIPCPINCINSGCSWSFALSPPLFCSLELPSRPSGVIVGVLFCVSVYQGLLFCTTLCSVSENYCFTYFLQFFFFLFKLF